MVLIHLVGLVELRRISLIINKILVNNLNFESLCKINKMFVNNLNFKLTFISSCSIFSGLGKVTLNFCEKFITLLNFTAEAKKKQLVILHMCL